MRELIECFRLLVVSSFLFSSIRIASTVPDRITLGQSIRDGETVVSADERFELGFFSPGTSRSRYLGIWYKKVAPLTTVWVANRNTPISDHSGVLRINPGGILVLLNSTNNIVWSSNTSRTPKNPVAALLKSGNLVLKDGIDNNPDNFLWQSFDNPGDTLLPGMKLGINFVTGQEWFFTSWKSADEPSQGDFTGMVDPSGYPQLILKKGPVIVYRAGSWNGLHWTGYPLLTPNSIYVYNFVINEKEVIYTFHIKDSSVLSRVVLHPSGVVQRFTWINLTRTWLRYYAKMRDECDKYAKCGANAICNINNFPICTCLEGFVPKSVGQWDVYNWSAGCIRKASLDCEHGDGFLKLEDVKLPETSHSWAEKYISLVECKKLCFNNCSCNAYANLDIREGGSGCLLWFSDLIDIRDMTEGGQDLYVRVAASESGNTKSRRQRRGKKYVIIIVTSIISGMVVLILVWIRYMLKIKRWNKDGNQEMDDNVKGSTNDDSGLPIYDLSIIANATNNFSDKNKIGEGGFGPVYKGTLIEGQEIAVKMLSKCSEQGIEEFKNETMLIAKLQHRNLIKLLGCCTHKDERMLIYEYMPNKSLDYFIFDKTRRKLLDWSKRIQIIRGIARGLLYLHQDSRLRIIHRDLKVSNVLLDNDMNPKIADFGLSRTFGGDQIDAKTNRVVGT